MSDEIVCGERIHAGHIHRARRKLATGINVFTLPTERHQALIDTLTAINREILTHKYPMIVSANFHRAIDAPIIVNYNQYTDRAQGQFLRTQANVAPLMKRTHDLSEKHEIRWYEIADVVTAAGPEDRIEIRDDRGSIGVVGIFTVAADKQGELLALLKRYGEALKVAPCAGLYRHRDASWLSARVCLRATSNGRASMLTGKRSPASPSPICSSKSAPWPK